MSGLSNSSDEWGDRRNAYKDIFPNIFYLLRPGAGLGHNTIIFMIECQVNYFVEFMRYIVAECDINGMVVKKYVNEKYQSWVQDHSGFNYTFWPSHYM